MSQDPVATCHFTNQATPQELCGKNPGLGDAIDKATAEYGLRRGALEHMTFGQISDLAQAGNSSGLDQTLACSPHFTVRSVQPPGWIARLCPVLTRSF